MLLDQLTGVKKEKERDALYDILYCALNMKYKLCSESTSLKHLFVKLTATFSFLLLSFRSVNGQEEVRRLPQ